jgi:uncharacterized caspase-like protein
MYAQKTPPQNRQTLLKWWTLFLLLALAPAHAAVRALVWAADYRTAANHDLELANTLVDARAVAETLRKLGVQDLRLLENASAESWNREIQDFASRLKPNDVALLYYAGHAVQVNGQNYLLAADGATLVASENVLAPVMARARGTVFLIDACRDNPFRSTATKQSELKISAGSGKSRTIETISIEQLAKAADGLSQMGNLRGKNTIVLFSTDPGNVAQDGLEGSGSPFANAVVREFAKRQSLDSAIRGITVDVDKETASKQSPWRQGDLSFPLFLAGQPRFPVP